MHSDSIEIHTLILGQMQANCYLLSERSTKKTLIIDPGDDGDYITQTIIQKNLAPVAIMATHGHFDHIMASTELKLNFKIPFWISKWDAFLLPQMQGSAFHFLRVKADPPPLIDNKFEGKMTFKLGSVEIHIIPTPGHTPGSVCLHIQKAKVLFCGDLFFSGGAVGRTDFSYSNADIFHLSLSRIFKLPDDTIVYPGHGESTSIGTEREYRYNSRGL